MGMLRIPRTGLHDVFPSVEQTEAGFSPFWLLNRQAETHMEIGERAMKINVRQAHSECIAPVRMAGQ
jgi:hypothetical protein